MLRSESLRHFNSRLIVFIIVGIFCPLALANDLAPSIQIEQHALIPEVINNRLQNIDQQLQEIGRQIDEHDKLSKLIVQLTQNLNLRQQQMLQTLQSYQQQRDQCQNVKQKAILHAQFESRQTNNYAIERYNLCRDTLSEHLNETKFIHNETTKIMAQVTKYAKQSKVNEQLIDIYKEMHTILLDEKSALQNFDEDFQLLKEIEDLLTNN